MHSTEKVTTWNLLTLKYSLKHISTQNEHKRVHAEHIVQEGKENKINSTYHPTSKYWTAIQVMNNLSNIYKSRYSYDLPLHCWRNDCLPC